jgi:hypothetical protein
MNYNDDNLDLVEEIYLTQHQYIRWMVAETTRPDIFGTRGGKVALKNMSAGAELRNQSPPPSELWLMYERAYGPSKNRKSSQAAVSPPKPQPKPVRKLERPHDAVWTFFNYNCYVIGVHDDGTVVVRLAVDWCPNGMCRITRSGTLYEGRRVVEGENLADRAEGFGRKIQCALKEWVKSGEGRKMPPSIQRLIKHGAEARKIWPRRYWRSSSCA